MFWLPTGAKHSELFAFEDFYPNRWPECFAPIYFVLGQFSYFLWR